MGRVLSSENTSGMPTLWSEGEGHIGPPKIARASRVPRSRRPHARRETTCTRTGRPPLRLRRADRSGKAWPKPDMHVAEESDCGHSTDEAAEQEAEVFRGGCGGKGGTKENDEKHTRNRRRAECVCPRVWRRASDGAGKEAGKVHRSAAPSNGRSAAGELLPI